MSNLELYDNLNMLQQRMSQGVSLLYVIYECMRCGSFDTDVFTPAICGVYEYLSDIEAEWKHLQKVRLLPLLVSGEAEHTQANSGQGA